MNLEELKQLYGKLTQQNDEVKSTEFTWGLAKLNDIDALEFHYSLLKTKKTSTFFMVLEAILTSMAKRVKNFC